MKSTALKKFAGLALMAAAMGDSMGSSPVLVDKPSSRVGGFYSNKTPLTKKQKSARKKAKASKKARRRGK